MEQFFTFYVFAPGNFTFCNMVSLYLCTVRVSEEIKSNRSKQLVHIIGIENGFLKLNKEESFPPSLLMRFCTPIRAQFAHLLAVAFVCKNI